MKRAFATILAAAILITAGLVFMQPARAASPGSGFGEWGTSTRFGWHGSMIVNGIHTYCIFPGRPLPTGASEDRGTSFDAAGLDPQRLTAINMLVTTYGQTSDPVQAAGVGWAVKAIANWDRTLHTFGYPGDDLRGAIDWVFREIAPDKSVAVQNLAVSYYAEAMTMSAGPRQVDGTLRFTTLEDDPLRGTVTLESSAPDAVARIALEDAVFTDSGAAVRDDARAGEVFDITATAAPGAASVTVRGAATMRAGFLPAVHHFVTPGGQDTAGPAGRAMGEVTGGDEEPRELRFHPIVTTQVVSRYVAGGPYIDDVTFASANGDWGRTRDGGFVPVIATATLYRTSAEPAPSDDVPASAAAVGTLSVTTDPAIGPNAPYRVESEDVLPGPGFYTAVWVIEVEGQDADTTAFLEPEYVWREQFGTRSQVSMLAAVTSRADALASLGAPMADDVIIGGVLPADGADVSSSVFRVPDGTAAVDACVEENLVWSNATTPTRVTSPGITRHVAPSVPDFGTYVWRERVVDAAGVLVHEGQCGLENETTRAPMPTVTTRAPAEAGWGDAVSDTAVVDGLVPAVGDTSLVFSVYEAPPGVAAANACTGDALVATTSAMSVTGAGTYVSPPVRLTSVGTFFWIEQLWHRMPDAEPRLLAQGECGVAEETTVVSEPSLVTHAVERAAPGAPYTDSATIDGLGSLGDGVAAELVFSIYHTDTGESPICTDATLEQVTPPIPVDGSGEYVSPVATSDLVGTKLWVAELRGRPTPDAEPIALARGTCGDDAEQTIVDALAVTGSRWTPVDERSLGAISALVLGAGLMCCAAGVWFRNRRRAADSEEGAMLR